MLRLLSLVLIFFEVCYSGTNEDLKALRTLMLLDYDPQARPDSTVNVYISLHLLGINYLEPNDEVLSANGRLTVRWDNLLLWNPETQNVEYIHAGYDELWKPYLIIENTASHYETLGDDKVKFRIKYTGMVTWELPVNLNVHCNLNMKYYPMDTQTCSVSLSSWSYSNDEVILHADKDKIMLDVFTDSSEWSLDDTQRTAVADNVTTQDYSYSRLTFYITMSRQTSYYGLHTILPLLLLSGLMSLMFIVSPESGEKITYCITIYLINMVLYVGICFQLPLPVVETSILGIYYSVVLFWNSLAVLMTAIVIQIYGRTTDMSQSVRAILNIVTRVTCRSRDLDVIHSKGRPQSAVNTNISVHDMNACSTLPNGDMVGYKRHGRLSPINRRIIPLEQAETMTTTTTTTRLTDNTEPDHDEVSSSTENDNIETTKHSINKKDTEIVSQEDKTRLLWKELSHCLDSIFCVVFLFVSFIIHLVFIAVLFASR
ncbi:Neuronal acetylcholine receptor subunit alpha-7 [Mactra antiquata]